MDRIFVTKDAYVLESKFVHYQKCFLEAFKELHDHDLSKHRVFVNYPEYRELFGRIEFSEYQKKELT